MADLYSTIGQNHKAAAGTGLGPRTQIVVTDAAVADEAALQALVTAAGAAGFTVAGIAGSVGSAMHIALQGGGDADGLTLGQAVSIVADFNDEGQNGGITA